MQWLWVVALLVGASLGQQPDRDSLRGALEAIENRRQRDLANPTLYYVDHFKPPFNPQADDEGQPEEIGNGYQKSFAPRTTGLFEAVPLPESELGSHSPGVINRLPESSPFDNMILDYIEENMVSSPNDPSVYNYQTADKRSVFRERDIHNPAGAMQDLFPEGESPERYFENGELHQRAGPSMFRERFSSKPSNHQALNAQNLVKHFGGINRDTESFPRNSDDPDDYLSVLNSVWEKYQDSNPDNVDPEELSEDDVEEILDYINHRQEKRRPNENQYYEGGYEFLNSPLAWVKRDTHHLMTEPQTPTDQFLHAHKFLNGHVGKLKSIKEGNVPDDEPVAGVARLLMEEQESRNGKKYQKRFWRGNTYEGQHRNKRYPVAKRSSTFYTSPAVLYNRAAAEKLALRTKKNIQGHTSDSTTDPKVAEELNNIFSSSDNTSKLEKNSTDHNHSSNSHVHHPPVNEHNDESTHNNKTNIDKGHANHSQMSHNHKKRSGQKEETAIVSQHSLKSKKSVDWSDYFGIDRRRKKSSGKPENDEWLLDQYLKAYSLSAHEINDHGKEAHDKMKRKNTDDMDAKLQAMEDMIVDQVLKYTGAHEGITDSEQIQAVKDRVIAQLAAAYSLEKMRKALGEFKSSMAAQKSSAATAHTSTRAPVEEAEHRESKVESKGANSEATYKTKSKKDDADNNISPMNHAANSRGHNNPSWNEESSCPVMEDIAQKCKEIANIAGDDSDTFLPLCNLYQVCYLCGPETGTSPTGCDVAFLSAANGACGGGGGRCRYLAHRTLAAMHSLRGPPTAACDWQAHPCLARYLAATLR